jgi:hypothetical protein
LTLSAALSSERVLRFPKPAGQIPKRDCCCPTLPLEIRHAQSAKESDLAVTASLV